MVGGETGAGFFVTNFEQVHRCKFENTMKKCVELNRNKEPKRSNSRIFDKMNSKKLHI